MYLQITDIVNVKMQGNTTVTFDNGMTTATMQNVLNSLPKDLNGYVLTIQFEDGTYNMTNALTFSGFHNGNLYVNGNLNEANATTLHTTQSVFLDFHTAGSNGLYLINNSCLLYVRNLKIRIADVNNIHGVYFYSNSHRCDIRYCYVYADGKTTGNSAIRFQNAFGIVYYNYISNTYHGIMGMYGQIASINNQSIGTNPNYGLSAYHAGTIGKNSTQPIGSTVNEYELGGGKVLGDTDFMNQWASIANIPVITAYGGYGVVDNILYAGAGLENTSGGVGKRWWAYNPSTNVWTEKTSLPSPVEIQTSITYGGNIYLFRGNTGYSCYRYNVSANTWTTITTFPGTWQRCMVGAEVNGIFYMGVGGTNTGGTQDWWSYNPSNNTWAQKANCPYRLSGGVAEAYNGLIYYFVGNRHLRYNPANNTWADISSTMPYSVSERPNSAVMNGKMYAVCGGSEYTPVNTNIEYDFTTNVQSLKTSFPGAARQKPYIGVINGFLYCGSGRGSGQTTFFVDGYKYY